jgi:hypothetical protein
MKLRNPPATLLERALILAALLLPLPASAAELWCMPDTICNSAGKCHRTTDEETSIRLNDLAAPKASLRSNAEDVPMHRTENSTVLVWRGTNSWKASEELVVTKAGGSFTYTVKGKQGTGFKATGQCEVQ